MQTLPERSQTWNWQIRCSSHTYVTLTLDGRFVGCYDNDGHYMEEIIQIIEKRTKMKFSDIPIDGSVSDFDGLRFLHGGARKGADWLNKEVAA